MSDQPMSTEDAWELAEKVIRQFGVSCQEAFEQLANSMNRFVDELERECPEAFDEEGKLRDDWLEILGAKASVSA